MNVSSRIQCIMIVKFYNKVKTKNKKVFSYYRIPYIIWGTGLLFIGTGCWLMYVANSRAGAPATVSGFQGR